ncbi:Uncharacterized protein GBIM_06138 [Gryllus bimaculatus]|nr:Uncharacterized protein GBIM_06138 [Gryllus bimaculatus]
MGDYPIRKDIDIEQGGSRRKSYERYEEETILSLRIGKDKLNKKGQRKAHYEESDAEKKRNSEKVRQLKKEIKELYLQLRKPGKFDETTLRVQNQSVKDVNALRNKRNEEVAVIIDYKNVDKQKKLDLLKYQSKKQQEKLKKLTDEYKQLTSKIANEQAKKKSEAQTTQRICTLENQIHRVEMNMMEAEHIKKKYCSIRSSLLEDSVHFESSLLKLEGDIQKQEKEIQHLQGIHKEALELRDMTKGTLMKQEIMALNAGKNRDRQLVEFRARVEDRKHELERLERRIFPSARALVHQDSASSSEVTQSMAEESATAKTTSMLEAAFNKLKEATGETEIDEVLQRFLSQRETMSRLAYLRTITEKEKKDLEMKKDFMVDELEAFKFAASKDKEQNMEEVDKVKTQLQEQKSKRERAEVENQNTVITLLKICNILYDICKKLERMDSTPVPNKTNDPKAGNEYIKLLEQKLSSTLVYISLCKENENAEEAKEIPSLKKEAEEAWMLPAPAKPAEGKTVGLLPVSETDEEEDVPSRSYLKRQAQIIVDAKSRRKQFNFNRGRK